MSKKLSPIVEKLRETPDNGIRTTSGGVRIRIVGVSHFELQELAMRGEDIPIPIFVDPETGREIENPADPDYNRRKDRADTEQGFKVLESMLIGVELIDGLPNDARWVDILKFKEKRGLISLEGLDLDNPIEKEFAYKKYVVFVEDSDWGLLNERIRRSQEAATKADAVFQGDEERAADSGTSPEGSD